MGSVFKKAVTRPLPQVAEIFTRQGVRLARWRDGKGKTRTAPVTTGKDGSDRIRDESATYVARYRDGDGILVEISTGCRDKTAAQGILAELERKGERVRAGLLTPAEARTAEHLATPISEHVAAYIGGLEASGASERYVRESRRILNAVTTGCDFRNLADLDREALERWLNLRRTENASARTRNTDRATLNAFANWCAEPSIGRIVLNPFKGVSKADEKADPRRRRRAMTEAELVRLLEVARSRPVLNAMTVHRGKRKGQAVAKLRPEVRAQLESLGRERALVYKTLVLTGLRKNELATLSVAQLHLDGSIPYLELDADDEKNREGNSVVIRPDLAADLRCWLVEKLAAIQVEAKGRGEEIPTCVPGDSPVFDIPDGLVRIFDRDLKLAGIAKRDDSGRTLDIHALRTTFGTLLSKGGVPLRTAQAAMRHSDPSLTANVYTDPRLLDVSGALDALPSLPLGTGPDSKPERVRAVATGTNDRSLVALPVAQTSDKPRQTEGIAGQPSIEAQDTIPLSAVALSGNADKGSGGMTTGVKRDRGVETKGIEPSTSWLQTRCSTSMRSLSN
jgi:integrase